MLKHTKRAKAMGGGFVLDVWVYDVMRNRDRQPPKKLKSISDLQSLEQG